MASKAALTNYDSDASTEVTFKNKARTGILTVHKQQSKKTTNNKVSQSYCVLCKNSVTTKCKYKLHISETFFGRSSEQESIKEGLGGSLGNRNNAAKQYPKCKNKWKRDLKSLKNKKKSYISWLSAPAHIASCRISRRSVPRHPRNTNPLAAVDLSVILISPSLVTVSDMKKYNLMDARR